MRVPVLMWFWYEDTMAIRLPCWWWFVSTGLHHRLHGHNKDGWARLEVIDPNWQKSGKALCIEQLYLEMSTISNLQSWIFNHIIPPFWTKNIADSTVHWQCITTGFFEKFSVADPNRLASAKITSMEAFATSLKAVWLGPQSEYPLHWTAMDGTGWWWQRKIPRIFYGNDWWFAFVKHGSNQRSPIKGNVPNCWTIIP